MRARKMRITLFAATATRCESCPRWSSNTYEFLRDSVASSSHEASLRRAADIAPRCTRSLRRRRPETHATSAPWPDCLAFVEDRSSRGLPEAVVLSVAEIERRRGADDAATTGDRSDAGLAGTPSLVGGGRLGTRSPWDKPGRSHLGLVFLDIPGNEARAMGLLFAGIAEGGLWPAFEPGDLAHVDWAAVAMQIPNMLALILVILLSLVMNLSGLELAANVELEWNREFKAAGLGSLVAGLGGSPPGCRSTSGSIISQSLGDWKRNARRLLRFRMQRHLESLRGWRPSIEPGSGLLSRGIRLCRQRKPAVSPVAAGASSRERSRSPDASVPASPYSGGMSWVLLDRTRPP